MMNATNRGVNRFVLLLVGVVLLAAGAVAVLVQTWSVAAELWRDGADAVSAWLLDADEATRIGDGSALSGLRLGALVVLLLIVIVALVIITRVGGGRGHAVIRSEGLDDVHGLVTVDQRFASDAITHALDDRADVLSVKVDARRVRGQDVMHVSVTPRQNTSPAEIATTVGQLVDNFAVLTGRQTPTYVSIHAGIRSRLAADQARVR